jgi:hypothetical protein
MHRLVCAFAACAALALVSAPAAAQVPRLSAHKTQKPVVLDGRLDDDAWQGAETSRAFTQKFPAEGAAPTEPTSVRVLYDDDAIYVGIDCPQTHSPVTPRLTRRDRSVESDWVAIDLDTRKDRKSAVEFLVNASGVMVDGLRVNDIDYSSDWDESWEARTDIHPGGWSVEMRLPLRILRFPRLPVQSWGLQVRRYISARQETDEWSYIPRAVAAEVSRYGWLDALDGLEPQSPLELRPFVLGRVRSREATVDTTGHGMDFGFSGGIDLKWHPSQDLTLDGTINPDFAQVEADQIVLNLSTYEVYKPEKRPFFLEGADLVAPKLGLPLVYTKRIGRAPDLPKLRSDDPFGEKLVDLPEPSPIYGATKLTGRLSEKISIGQMSALVGPNDVDVDLADGTRLRRRIEPLTAFNVLRLKHDLGDNAHVGTLFTATNRAEDTSRYIGSPYTPGNVLCPNQTRPDGSTSTIEVRAGERCWHDAYVGSVDGRMRLGEFVTVGQVVASAIERGPTRHLADGTTIGAGDADVGSDFYMGKEGGKHWLGYTWYGNAGRKLDFNDLGFMWRQNVRYFGGGVEYRTLEPWWETLETHTRLDWSSADSMSGIRIGRDATLGFSTKLKSFWTVGAEMTYRAPRLDDREVGDGTALERGRGFRGTLRVGTDPRGKVAFSGSTSYMFVETGYVATGDGNLTWRVVPQLDVELGPQVTSTAGEPRYATDGLATNAHLYAPLTARNLSATMRATYTFLPTLSFVAYAQAFLASGHYGSPLLPRLGAEPVVKITDLVPTVEAYNANPDFQQGALNVNALVRWEYKLGSILSLVYARTQYPKVVLGPTEPAAIDVRSISRAPAIDALYLKVSYFWG